jgi:Tfp pilus assembly protein PilN
MFDLNILPQRYRRTKLTIWMVLPLIILLALIGALYPAYQGAVSAQSTFNDSKQALTQTQLDFEASQANNQDLLSIEAEIELELERQNLILSSYGGLQVADSKWSPTLKAIVRAAPAGIRWSSISQDETGLRLEGIAENYPLIISLVDTLRPLDGLNQLEISSVDELITDEEVVFIPAEPETEEDPGEPETPYRFVLLAAISGEVLP